MSKIRLHGSSSGYTEIAPVAASGNNTITLPNDGTIISKDANGAVGVTSITVGTGVTIGTEGITCAKINGGQIAGRRNIIINGAMNVAQRGTSFTGVTASGTYPVDRFLFHVGSLGTWTLTQSTDVPTGQGFAKSIKCDVTTANSSPSGTAYARIDQRFEGQDVQAFCKGTSNAKQFAVSFWVKSPKTGTHIVQFQDADNTRNVSKAYTVSAADTWEKKELIFPADTTGAFDNDNALSLRLCFYLAVGTGYQGGTLQTTWGTPSDNTRATGQVNVADSTDNNFYLTGVQLEVGSQASAFEHRSFGEELTLCQRYFYPYLRGTNSYENITLGYSYASDTGMVLLMPPVEMRTTPSFTSSGSLGINDGGSDSTSPNFAFEGQGSTRCFRVNVSNISTAGGRAYQLRSHGSTSSKFELSAEL